jgi:hypothetical protein
VYEHRGLPSHFMQFRYLTTCWQLHLVQVQLMPAPAHSRHCACHASHTG